METYDALLDINSSYEASPSFQIHTVEAELTILNSPDDAQLQRTKMALDLYRLCFIFPVKICQNKRDSRP